MRAKRANFWKFGYFFMHFPMRKGGTLTIFSLFEISWGGIPPGKTPWGRGTFPKFLNDAPPLSASQSQEPAIVAQAVKLCMRNKLFPEATRWVLTEVLTRGGPVIEELEELPPPPFAKRGGGKFPFFYARKNSKIKEKLKKKGEKSKKSALRAEFTLNLHLFCLDLAKIELFQGSRPPNLKFLVKNRNFLRASETLFSNLPPDPPPGDAPWTPIFLVEKKIIPPPFEICTGRPWFWLNIGWSLFKVNLSNQDVFKNLTWVIGFFFFVLVFAKSSLKLQLF